MLKKLLGFTLMEVIGVLAVIAIIAAFATPQIFQAIQDARVTQLVQEANNLKPVVARFYKDTGTWPRHIPSHADKRYHQLMTNTNAAGTGTLAGWDGPYLEAELQNPITPGGYVDLLVTASTPYACDLDADGVNDGTFITYRVDGITDDVAQKISQMIDKDGDQSTGNADWKKAGRVKRYNGNHGSILIMCLGRV